MIMQREPNSCIIGVGSNINAEENIQKMLDILGRLVSIEKVSTFLRTKPIGITQQEDFTNGAVRIETSLSAEELKSVLVQIEDELGRDRNLPKFGPRTLDLDIVVWNGKIVDDDYFKRDFLKDSIEEISSI
jgi:2-amino-4-hydroxy-6-hydroxymethyldihydropteridine diphosphokinase